MKKFTFLFIFFLLLVVPFSQACAACTGSSPTWSCTPDFTSLHNLLVHNTPGTVQSGDTVNVSAGSEIWPIDYDISMYGHSLSITKAIILQGAGIGTTVITGTNAGDNYFLISYAPDISETNLLRITGFTFNITEQQAIVLWNPGFPPIYKIRIDHNRFTNCATIGRSAVMNKGCRGVIDNNTFDNLWYPLGVGNGTTSSGQSDWANLPDLVFGAANDNMYVEDNVFTNISLGVISDGDQGGRWAFRYNTITTGADSYPLLDLHGGGGGLWGCMGAELYGNYIIGTGNLLSDRGGRITSHHNYYSGGDGPTLYQRRADPCSSEANCPPSPYLERQLINSTYHFLNRNTSVSVGNLCVTQPGEDCCAAYPSIIENTTYWKDNTGCTKAAGCATGIGCGTLANLPDTCTTGVGYWATNQSCTNLSGMVGVNPATPISGTLYKCTATNTWTAYYTPYTYPHSLREADTTPPVITPSWPPAITSCTSHPTDINVRVITDENATCKYTQQNASVSYDAMLLTFPTSLGMSHSGHMFFGCGQAYNIWVRCMDGSGNKNTSSYNISFEIPPMFRRHWDIRLQ